MKYTLALFVLILLLIAGCSTVEVQEERQYLLRHDVSEEAAGDGKPVRIGLARLSVAPYLNQRGLVLATSGNVIRPAKLHVWAEPIDQGALAYLRRALSVSVAQEVAAFGSHAHWDQVIEVFIETFHGHQDGRVELVAQVQIKHVKQNNQLTHIAFAESTRLRSDGYDALVEAHKELLDRLAVRIAREVE